MRTQFSIKNLKFLALRPEFNRSYRTERISSFLVSRQKPFSSLLISS